MSSESQAYYRASLALLKHVEGRKPTNRRFGGEADALWAQFRGDLTVADRIDTLLRDADAQWPGSFGARNVFRLHGVAEDDSFGAEWTPLDGMAADDLWREVDAASVESVADVLEAVASAWGLELVDVAVDAVGAAEHVVVAGPSAVAALVAEFAKRDELSWADQVSVVATPAAHRQVAAAAGAVLGVARAVTIIDCSGALPATPTKPRLLLSEDASDDDASKARALTGRADA